jgi:hypothetical protein
VVGLVGLGIALFLPANPLEPAPTGAEPPDTVAGAIETAI